MNSGIGVYFFDGASVLDQPCFVSNDFLTLGWRDTRKRGRGSHSWNVFEMSCLKRGHRDERDDKKEQKEWCTRGHRVEGVAWRTEQRWYDWAGMKNTEEQRKKKNISPIMPHSGRAIWRKEVWRDGVWRGCKESMQRNKKQEEVVWGQRWLPVCLWHMSQLALTVNAGKTTFPKAGQRRWGGGGRRQSDGC